MANHFLRLLLCLLLTTCATTACTALRPRPTLKIALVAPFEGRQRQVGYAVFPALRLALREQNAAGSIGNYYVELVAYNDNADPTFAARVAHNVAQDESVVAVIGHLLPLTTNAALPVYAKAGLSVLSMEGTTASCDAKTYVFRGPINPTPPEQARAETAMQRFAEVSGGPPAGASSAAAYTATRRVLAAIQKTSTQPTRANVGKTLGALLGCW